jgi:predicted negative regulator of RcsB-dependent stress response
VDDLLTDQQQAERVRRWVADNGWYLLGGLVLGLAALLGWRQWQSAQTSGAEQASAVYEELLGAISVERTARAEELAAQLANDHGGTPYVDQARLAMARLKMDRNAPDEALEYLRQVAEDGSTEDMRHIGRLRVARVLAEQQKYDEALAELTVPVDSVFAARYHEVRGDVYHAMGKFAESRDEYQKALANGEPGVIDQALVQAKLDDLGLGAAPASPPAADDSPQPAPAPAGS